MGLQYTPGQLRNAAAITPETYRHWKKLLAPLRRQKGHSPCFSVGDIVSVTVVRVLAIDFGIRVSVLSPLSEDIFALCNSTPWPTLERGRLVLDIPGATVRFRLEVGDILADGPAIIVPFRPLIARLREQIFAASEPERQTTLRFPPPPLAPTDEGHAARTRP